MRLLLAAVFVTACRVSPPGGRLDARLIRPTINDTTRISTTARATACARGRGILFAGIEGGSGVLAWIRGPAPMEGGYAPLPRGDTLTRRGAVVTARLGRREPSSGVLFDSGTVVLSATGGLITARIEGRGTDLASSARVGMQISFDSIPAPTDTAECRVAL